MSFLIPGINRWGDRSKIPLLKEGIIKLNTGSFQLKY